MAGVTITASLLPQSVSAQMATVSNDRYNMVHDYDYLFRKAGKSEFQIANTYTKIYNSSFKIAPRYTSGAPIAYANIQQIGTLSLPYQEAAMGFAVTQTVIDDNNKDMNFVTTLTKNLMDAVMERREVDAANVLNRAFTATEVMSYDGLSLCNTAHAAVEGTWSNMMSTTAALGQSSLESMLIQISGAKDFTGTKYINLTGKKIHISKENQMVAMRLLESVLEAGTANNNINVLNKSNNDGKYLSEGSQVWKRFTSPTAWFISTDVGEDGDALLIERRDLDIKEQPGIDTDTRRYVLPDRNLFLVQNPLFIYGTQGGV